MTGWAIALPGVPFLAALVGLLLPLRSRTAAAALGIAGAAGALVAAVVLAAGVDRPFEAARSIADLGDLAVTFGVRMDPAAALIALTVGAVALAVQVYSVAYLHGDDRYPPYAAQVSLFTAAMLLVVVSSDLIQLLVGWEVMGACSYLLIGHDRKLPEAPRAAVKAFLVTRVGDVGFLIGIVMLGLHASSFRITDVLASPPVGTELTVACVLLLAGVAGKSAQFPLHTWLPDAMAGPTPISALIHAATMVAAGVYVVARLFPLFAAAPVALTVLAVMASITMLIGAVAALAQDDIKRVLAWSTVSQLGYMTGALAVGVPAAAMFHLLTHAAFKALLFLAAGVVIHAVGSNSLAAMGGLRRTMPATFVAATVGLAALAGVPPFAGFWSKDAIIAAAWERDRAVAAVMVATAVLTAWYATRLWLRAFFGRPRGPAAAAAHEPVWAMRAPVLLLAVPAALLGFAGIGTGLAARLESAAHQIGLDPTARPAGVTSTLHLAHLGADTVPALLAVATGCLGAWFVWRRDPAADPAETGLGPLVSVSRHAFWLDDVQNALVVRPVAALARVTRRADEGLVDGAVEGVGRGVLGGGGLLQRAHRGALPRAATATLAGGVLAALTAVVVEALR